MNPEDAPLEVTMPADAALPFGLPQELLTRNHAGINWQFIKETLFILPCNDGEAKRACQILRALKVPYLHVSNQRWGATLDEELGRLRQDWLAMVKRVLIFEMPGRAARRGEPMRSERELEARGLELCIVDHHHYLWIDRQHPASSLEQLCQHIGWPLSPTDLAIAVNDRSYIPGLKKLGLSLDAILHIRFYDLEAQGHDRSYIDRQRGLAQREIKRFFPNRQDELWVVSGLQVEKSFLIQELALQRDDGVVHVLEQADHKLSFSGAPAAVDALMSLDYTSYGLADAYVFYAGGDPRGSKYWGFRLAPGEKKIPPALLARVFSLIKAKL